MDKHKPPTPAGTIDQPADGESFRPCDTLSDPQHWHREGAAAAGTVDIYWINDGAGWVKLSRPVRCF